MICPGPAHAGAAQSRTPGAVLVETLGACRLEPWKEDEARMTTVTGNGSEVWMRVREVVELDKASSLSTKTVSRIDTDVALTLSSERWCNW